MDRSDGNGAVRPIREADEIIVENEEGKLWRKRTRFQDRGEKEERNGLSQDQNEPNEQGTDEEEKKEKEREEGEEGEEGEKETDEEEEEEGEKPKVIRAPRGPTKKEREEHECTHMPYRAWCKYCVKGKGRNKPHKKQKTETEEKTIPRISMDYFSMNQDDEKASKNPMILMTEEPNGHRYMRAVGQKGLGEGSEMGWIIKDMDDGLKSWGHPGGAEEKLIFKSDGEPAMKFVREALARYHGGTISPEQPPTGESQANGYTEEAGKTVRGLVKVMKEQMEDRAGMKLEPEDVIMQWMVRWAAMMYSRLKVGPDGKTAFERQRGKKCKTEVVPFGEKVMYERLKDGGRKNIMESNFEEGLWLGHTRQSNEILVGTEEGVVRAWAIKRVPEAERWSEARIKNMKGTPQKPDPN